MRNSTGWGKRSLHNIRRGKRRKACLNPHWKFTSNRTGSRGAKNSNPRRMREERFWNSTEFSEHGTPPSQTRVCAVDRFRVTTSAEMRYPTTPFWGFACARLRKSEGSTASRCTISSLVVPLFRLELGFVKKCVHHRGDAPGRHRSLFRFGRQKLMKSPLGNCPIIAQPMPFPPNRNAELPFCFHHHSSCTRGTRASLVRRASLAYSDWVGTDIT